MNTFREVALTAVVALVVTVGCSGSELADATTLPIDSGSIPAVPFSPTPGATPTPTATPQASNAANVRDFGAVGDGQTDDTAAFRAAAATGKDLFVPGTSAHYRVTGRIDVHGSVTGDGSMPEIRMYGASGSRDHQHTIFALDNYQGPGVVFSGLHLNGQWDGGANGEWEHGIQIQDSSNITIEGNVIENAYGDDIVLDQVIGVGAKNVVIRNNTLKNPRRCAIAVISGANVLIEGNTISKPNDYVSAIDLEPDPGSPGFVAGVKIQNNTFDVATTAVLLYNWDGMPVQNDVTVTGNSGRAGNFFISVGGWSGVNVSANAF